MIYLLSSYNKHGKFNKMPFKVAILLLAAMIFRRGDTSIAKSLNINL